MAELQFKVDTTALQTIQSTELKANFEEMTEALTEFVKPYESIIVTDDGIGMAKVDRAKLRSVAKHVDDYRKMVKRTYTEPLKEFEDQCKKLNAIIDRGISNLDGQVKMFEQKRREEKLSSLNEYFDDVQKKMKHPEYASWEQVMDERWGNVTFDSEQAKRDIDLACFRIDHEVQSIVDLDSEFEVALLDNYSKSHLLYETLQMNDRLVADKKRKEEQQKRLEEEYKQKRAEKEARAAAAKVIEKTNPTPKAEEQEQTYIANFRVFGRYEEVAMIRRFLDIKHVDYSLETIEKTNKPADAVLG
jgi:uncharacterized phage infection (PIP) family protein YhgE